MGFSCLESFPDEAVQLTAQIYTSTDYLVSTDYTSTMGENHERLVNLKHQWQQNGYNPQMRHERWLTRADTRLRPNERVSTERALSPASFGGTNTTSPRHRLTPAVAPRLVRSPGARV